MLTTFKKIFFYLVLLLISANSHAEATSCQQHLSASPAYPLLAKLGVTIQKHVQQDFPSVKTSSACYFQAWPETTEQVANLVKVAYQYHIPIRTQGSAHSQNGSSLPQYSELLINTSLLNTVAFNKIGTVTTGAGIPLFLLQDFLNFKKYGTLPVINGGGSGPSVGGFITAGGVGETSRVYGGFWENIDDITVVSGFGKIIHLKKNDPRFPWLFGSMGQLGIITEVTLKLLPFKPSQKITYPHRIQVQLLVKQADGARWIGTKRPIPMYWVNLFVPLNQVQSATKDLKQLQDKYSTLLDYHPTFYYWPVKYFSITPPLIFPLREDFMAMGFFGYPKSSQGVDKKMLFELEKDFTSMVQKKKYHRYIQAELSCDPKIYQAYFGLERYNQFKAIKLKFDPEFLFNKHSVFP